MVRILTKNPNQARISSKANLTVTLFARNFYAFLEPTILDGTTILLTNFFWHFFFLPGNVATMGTYPTVCNIPIRTSTENNIYIKDTYQAMFARVQILASRLEKRDQ
jgi:hypothetical protein